MIMQKVSTKSAVAARPARSAVVVRASADRRAVLSGFLAGAAALTVANQAQATATPVDIFDDRKVKGTGFDLIYEARELDLPQSVRDGLTQGRTNLEDTKSRVKESEKRIDSTLEPYIKKNYWTLAREELRLQAGTLRFDLGALAETKAKDEKKKAQALRKDFIAKVEALDYALRSKDEASSLKKLEDAKSALDTVLAAVL